MNSNYKAVPVKPLIELQHRSNDTKIKDSPHNLSPEGYRDEFDEIDEFPLMVDGGRPDLANAGVAGAVFNLATSIIGAGIMALPAAMKVLGIGFGMVSILVMGILSEISIEMLVRFAVHTNSASYGELVQVALGMPMRIVSEICIIINNAGVLVVYLIIVGDVMSGSPEHAGVFDQLFGGHGLWDNRRLVVLVVLILFLVPLCALDKIDSLSLSSAASVALAIVFVVVAFIVASIKLAEGKIDKPRMAPDLASKTAVLDLLVVIPIMTNAYVCHFNIQPIYNELEGKSTEKMNRIGRISTLLCVVVYAATAISGYLLFGDDTESDVLANFDKDLGIHSGMVLNYIVRIGYVLHLILVFPVINFSLRQTVDALIFTKTILDDRKKSLALTAVLLGSTYFASTVIPNIWTAFKFTGATTGLSLGFIFPSLVALKLDNEGESLTPKERMFSVFMLSLAVVVSIIGVTANIISLERQ